MNARSSRYCRRPCGATLSIKIGKHDFARDHPVEPAAIAEAAELSVVARVRNLWIDDHAPGRIDPRDRVARDAGRLADQRGLDRKRTRLNSSHVSESRMPSF